MEEIRKSLEACYVLPPAWRRALDRLAVTDKRLLLIQGASGSGRMLLAEMASCLLTRRRRLKQSQPMVTAASALRGSEGIGKLKNAVAQARKEGRLLIVEEGELLSVFPEGEVAQLLKLLQHPEVMAALLIYDKMYPALQPVLAGIMSSAEVLTLPAMSGTELTEIVREMAQKRWYTLSDQAVQTIRQRAGDIEECTMGDASRIFRLALRAQRERCIRQGIPEGSRESRCIIAADVQEIWDEVKGMGER